MSAWTPAEIGSRWSREHKVVRDPDTGIFFERNPPLETSTELHVQRALLTKPRQPLLARIFNRQEQRHG